MAGDRSSVLVPEGDKATKERALNSSMARSVARPFAPLLGREEGN
jgi:predicted NodU family carbamoyl transferase